ncbi:hypothetical protein Peur_063442 [Populus x canadensis]
MVQLINFCQSTTNADKTYLTNGYLGSIYLSLCFLQRFSTQKTEAATHTNWLLETTIEWIPRMIDVRLEDFPSFILTTEQDEVMVN